MGEVTEHILLCFFIQIFLVAIRVFKSEAFKQVIRIQNLWVRIPPSTKLYSISLSLSLYLSIYLPLSLSIYLSIYLSLSSNHLNIPANLFEFSKSGLAVRCANLNGP